MLRSMSLSAAWSLRHAAAAALFSSSLLVGCAYGEMPQVLRAQVASEAGCPEIVVQQAPAYMGMSESQYKVRGCGIERVYTCNNPSGGMVKFGSADCSYVAAGAPKAPAVDAAPAPGAADPDADPALDEPSDTSG
jgi:hypothetical protein